MTSLVINKQNVLARFPLFSFFTLAILISWLLASLSLLFEMPFKVKKRPVRYRFISELEIQKTRCLRVSVVKS